MEDGAGLAGWQERCQLQETHNQPLAEPASSFSRAPASQNPTAGGMATLRRDFLEGKLKFGKENKTVIFLGLIKLMKDFFSLDPPGNTKF